MRRVSATHVFQPCLLWRSQHANAVVKAGETVRVVDSTTLYTPSGVAWQRVIIVETRDGRVVACAPSDVRRIRP